MISTQRDDLNSWGSSSSVRGGRRIADDRASGHHSHGFLGSKQRLND